MSTTKPAVWPMPTPRQAQANLDGLIDKVRAGVKIDLNELAAAQAAVDLASRQPEFEEQARRRAEQERARKLADEGATWCRTKAPALAAAVLAAMPVAVEASRVVAEAAQAYMAGVAAAQRMIGSSFTGWPYRRDLAEKLLAEVTAAGLGPPPQAPNLASALQAAVDRAAGEPPTPDEVKAREDRARREREDQAAVKRGKERWARALLDAAAKGGGFHPDDVAHAQAILGEGAGQAPAA